MYKISSPYNLYKELAFLLGKFCRSHTKKRICQEQVTFFVT